jgi:hypothetical protein
MSKIKPIIALAIVKKKNMKLSALEVYDMSQRNKIDVYSKEEILVKVKISVLNK